MREPPGAGGPGAAAVEALAEPGDLLLLAGPAAFCAAILVVLGRKGFLDYRSRLGPTEPPLWGAREMLAAFGVYMVSYLLSSFVAALFLVGRRPEPLEQSLAFLVSSLLNWIPTLAFISHVVRTKLGQPISVLGFRPVPWQGLASCVPLYPLLVVPMALLATVWQLFLQEAGVEIKEQDLLGTFRDLARNRDVASFAILGVLGVIVAPVCEETLFRGFIFGSLREARGGAVAAIISSALFATVHFSLSALGAIFMIGLVLCGIYARTGSLYTAILFHALFNGVSLLKAAHDGLRSIP